MEKLKQANASEREDGADMISNLPDHILQMILSRIPTTEEVTRTSVLSTRWRYLWTSVPSIDIDCTRRLTFFDFKRNKFKDFVYHVLASNSLDLDSFRLCCWNHYNMATIQRWIHAAVARNIKQLHLLFCCGFLSQSIELPHRLVTCGSLEVLRLSLYKRPLILPSITGFPALRVLELEKVELYQSNSVEKFLESCPLLEDLSLIDCAIFSLKFLCISCPKLKSLRLDNRNISKYEEVYNVDDVCGCIKIICPKLVYFEFGAFKAYEYIFKHQNSLKKAVIHPEGFPSEFYLFEGIYYLKSLSTSIDIFCHSLCPSVELPSLPNIKTLELTTGVDTHSPIFSKLIRYLTCLPHLESLHLIIEEEYFNWEDWKLDEAETRRILTCHLKRVEFLKFNKKRLMLDTARSLLEHGNVLEEMVFRWDCDEAVFHKRSMETMKEVSKFHKASSTVILITVNEISHYQLSGKP